MAGTIRCISKINLSLLTSNVTRQLIFKGVRTIYTDVSLGLVDFRSSKQQFAHRYRIGAEAFRTKIEKIVDNEKELIFTEDLKAILHLTEKSPYEVDLLKKCLTKYVCQSTGRQFNTFKFGPVVMRALHYLNEPDLARDLFMDSRFDDFFNEYTTFMVLLDLLYENQKYQDVCDVYVRIVTKVSAETSHPKMALNIVGLACYKLDTPESLEFALKIWRELIQKGHIPLRKYVAVTAALALKQNKPDVALELVSSCKYRNYISIRCIRLMSFAQLGRMDDIIMNLKDALTRGPEKNQYYRDTIEMIESTVDRLGIDESAEIRTLIQDMKSDGYISDITLSEHIQLPIETTRTDNSSNRMDSGWGQSGNKFSDGDIRAPRGRRFSDYENRFDQYGSA